MTKDPAILWYFSDWSGGTATFSRHQKGAYMDLLNAQFNSGPLSLEEIKTVLGNDFALWSSLSKKFKKTDEGLFFNEKMENEKLRRKNYVGSRKDNLSKNKLAKNSHMDSHMETATATVNEIENKKEIENSKTGMASKKNSKIFIAPSVAEVVEFFEQKGFPVTLAERAHTFYDVANWKDSNGKQVLNWKQKMLSVWLKDENKQFNNNNTNNHGKTKRATTALPNNGTGFGSL